LLLANQHLRFRFRPSLLVPKGETQAYLPTVADPIYCKNRPTGQDTAPKILQVYRHTLID
jgi:hypothetical protein